MKPLLFAIFAIFLLQNTLFAQSRGYANLYSDNFEGSTTANKDHYDKMGFSAAHRTIPFGTRITVRNVSNGKTVVVKVNDRASMPGDVAIKLSFAAARALGISKDHTQQVEIFTGVAATPKEQVAAYKVTTPPKTQEKTKPVVKAKPVAKQAAKKIAKKEKPAKYKVVMALPAAKPAPLPAIKWTTNQDGYELYQVAGARLQHEGYGIQIASSQQFDGIMRKIADLQALNIDGILLSIQNDKNTGIKTYKIIIGPYETAADAQIFRAEWLKKGLYGTFVVNLADQFLENMSF